MKTKLTLITLWVLLICYYQSLSQATTWRADPVHSSVQFEVSHLSISTVSGNFSDFVCTITSLQDSFDGAAVDAEVQVASITTENLTRDKHLKEDDFFNADKFPVMTFKSESFEKKGERDFIITGILTLRGTSKKISFPAKYSGMVTLGEKVISGFKAEFSINRFDYGLKWNDTIDTGSLVVGEEVLVKLNLELVKS